MFSYPYKLKRILFLYDNESYMSSFIVYMHYVVNSVTKLTEQHNVINLQGTPKPKTQILLA